MPLSDRDQIQVDKYRQQDQYVTDRYNLSQALLLPFKRELDAWSVSFVHDRRRKIREVDLVSTGDLESDWGIQVRAREDGVVLADFSFPEYGRFFDMRRRRPAEAAGPPFDEIKDWVERNLQSGRFKYSNLAKARGLAYDDPRVVHDVAWRIARGSKFRSNRRIWYNKGKEASINDLYDRLQAIARRIVGDLTLRSLDPSSTTNPS